MAEAKVALVTGGASGIGAAVTARLRGEGWSVVASDIAFQDDPADGRAGDDVHGDVASPASNDAVVAHVERRYGRLDAAFLNAGIATGPGSVEDVTLERFAQVLAIDAASVFYGLRSVLPLIRRSGGGDVVMTASLAGLTAVPFDPVYAMAKHAVVGFARSVGPVYAQEGIRVNALCPSFADTPIIDPLRETFTATGMEVLPVEDVVSAAVGILDSGAAGQAFLVQAGGKADLYRFRGVPGPAVRQL